MITNSQQERINQALADDINKLPDLTDEQRRDKMGGELANAVYVQITDRAAAKALAEKHKGNLPTSIDAFEKAVKEQPKKSEAATTSA